MLEIQIETDKMMKSPRHMHPKGLDPSKNIMYWDGTAEQKN